jgi:hypothetical protein
MAHKEDTKPTRMGDLFTLLTGPLAPNKLNRPPTDNSPQHIDKQQKEQTAHTIPPNTPPELEPTETLEAVKTVRETDMIRDGHSTDNMHGPQDGRCPVCDWLKNLWGLLCRAFFRAMRSVVFKVVLAFIIPQVVVWAMYTFYLGYYQPDEAGVTWLLMISAMSALFAAVIHVDHK